MKLPPDRGHVATEQRSTRARDLGSLDAQACVELVVEDLDSVHSALRGAARSITAFVEALVPRFLGGGRLVYLGAGTSGRLGVLDASECPPTFHVEPSRVVGVIAGGDAALRRSSEAREDDVHGAAPALDALCIGSGDTVLGIAAGGTTPFVIGGLALAAAQGAATALLTCAPTLPAAVSCDHVILLDTGPELLTGSTRLKAGTATKVALNAITTALFVQAGKVHENLMVDLRVTNDKLRDRALRILIELGAAADRPAAAALLVAANDELKTAVAMGVLEIDAAAARQRLAAAGDRLCAVLAPVQQRPA